MIGRRQQAGDNSVNLGGDNTGTISIGLTFEQHQAALREQEARIRADLERAHKAERLLLERELADVKRRLDDVWADYQRTLQELEDTKRKLQQYENDFAPAELEAAYNALDRGDRSLAESLFAVLEERWDAKAAEMAVERGQIAFADLRWQDALEHFERAAAKSPSDETLALMSNMLGRMGHFGATEEIARKSLTRSEEANDHEWIATWSNHLGSILMEIDRAEDAEPHFRKAIELGADIQGHLHPDYYKMLGNLATLLHYTGRSDAAVEFSQDAIELIGNSDQGTAEDFSTLLNNQAMLIRGQGKLDAAGRLSRQAVCISYKDLPKGHPYLARNISNYAEILLDLGIRHNHRPLVKKAARRLQHSIALDNYKPRDETPVFAKRLFNLAGIYRLLGQGSEPVPLYRRALEITQACYGDTHSKTRLHAHDYASYLIEHAPNDPALRELRKAFGPEIGRDA